MAKPTSSAPAKPAFRYPRRHSPPPPAFRRSYDRRTELPRVLPLWPHELEDESPERRRYVLCKLRRALRAERRRGIAGHWTYDLSRHVELLRVYRMELALSGVSGEW